MAMMNDFSVKGGYQAAGWLAGSGEVGGLTLGLALQVLRNRSVVAALTLFFGYAMLRG
jgi:hypothetical protein